MPLKRSIVFCRLSETFTPSQAAKTLGYLIRCLSLFLHLFWLHSMRLTLGESSNTTLLFRRRLATLYLIEFGGGHSLIEDERITKTLHTHESNVEIPAGNYLSN